MVLTEHAGQRANRGASSDKVRLVKVRIWTDLVFEHEKAISLVGEKSTLWLGQNSPSEQAEVDVHFQKAAQVKFVSQVSHNFLFDSLLPFLLAGRKPQVSAEGLLVKFGILEGTLEDRE